MEFYWNTMLHYRTVWRCFNSQRDGILRFIVVRFFWIIQGFNSQRDGILHGGRSFVGFEKRGFNSQRDGILLKTAPPLKTATNSFNSQRDGILLSDERLKLYWREFQFPTGWNSTVVIGLIGLIYAVFQFPTGWNSTKSYFHKPPRVVVSIPNGMEFYNEMIERGFLQR